MSLIFGIPVQTMLAKDVFDEGIHIDLYSFFYNKLIEISIYIEPNNFEKTYYEIKNNIELNFKKYKDSHFIKNEDIFIDNDKKTIIILMKAKTIILYFIDFESYKKYKKITD